MKQKLLLFALVSLTFSLTATAQQITGSVTDDNGIPLPGASIVIGGTSDGTTTNFDGNFTIDVSQGSTLIISYVGYESQEIVVGSSPINVQLNPDNALDEVVITALGISRERKSLGYSVTEVDGDQINTIKDHNIASSLVGKVAGLNITDTGSFGSASRIVLRGNNSITGNTQALVVVDGVPINQDGINSGGSIWENKILGGGLTDINPNDVESISVLKGPNASALYGSRAGNGVILITTKKGVEGDDLGITLNTNVVVNSPMILPELQNLYGQGSNGAAYTDITNDWGTSNWGAPLDGSSRMYFTGSTRAYDAQPNNMKDFFQSAVSAITSVSIQKGFEDGSVRFSYSNNDTQDLTPNSHLESHSFNLRGTMQLSDKLSIDAKATYFSQNVRNRKSNSVQSIYTYLYKIPRNVVLSDLERYQMENPGTAEERKVISYGGTNSQTGNPYWMSYHDENLDRRTRFFGFFKMDYDFTDWLTAFVRVGADYTDSKIERLDKPGHHFWTTGQYDLTMNNYGEFNTDFVVTANRDLTENLNLIATVGGTLSKRTTEGFRQFGDTFKIPTKFFFANAENLRAPEHSPVMTKKVNSVYGSINLAYDDFLYLDATGRNDWSSTLSEDNRSYFYNSVSLSALLTRFIDPTQETFNLFKIRAGIAEVGNDTDPYQLTQTFDVPGQGYLGLTTLSAPTVRANADLRSETITSTEFGIELAMLNNRLNLDLSYYNINTKDLIFDLPVAAATGYQFFRSNLGEVNNEGIELTIGGRPIQNSRFVWDTTFNYAANTNELVSLIDGVDNYTYLSTNNGNMQLRAQVGESIGSIYGTTWDTNDAGENLVSAEGRHVSSTVDNLLGNAEPDFIAGWFNTLRYDNFSLSFQIDGRFGGEFYAATDADMDASGVTANSLLYRDGVTIPGTNTGTGLANDVAITGQEYWGSYSTIAEFYVYDQTNIRLREVALGYQIPNTQRFGVESANIQLIGRNLFFIQKEANGGTNFGFDPESFLGTNIGSQGYQSYAAPSLRSIGLNLTLNF